MYTQDSVSIAPAAIKYIRERGGFAHIEANRAIGAGWCKVDLGPSVRLGEPRSLEIARHHQWHYEDVILYVPKNLLIPNPFSIVVSSFFWYQRLAIEGWKIV